MEQKISEDQAKKFQAFEDFFKDKACGKCPVFLANGQMFQEVRLMRETLAALVFLVSKNAGIDLESMRQ